MGIVDTKLETRTMECDTCKKSAKFDRTKTEEAVKDAPWLMAARFVQTGDGRAFVYCSDSCEVTGTATGIHNVKAPEPVDEKKVVSISDVNAQAAIKQAVEVARQQDEANRALKTGQPTTLHIG